MGLFKRTKNNKKPLVRQILDLIPKWALGNCIIRYKSDKGCSAYKTNDQLVALIFGQLCKCTTLADISTGLSVSQTFIADLGLAQNPAKSTMSDGNKKRSWQVFEMLYFKLLRHYEQVLKSKHRTDIIEEVKRHTIKLIDSTTIGLCLSLFDWAKFRTAKGGIKIHTCWDDTLQIPDMINITEALTHDSKGFEQQIFKKDTIIVEDKGYFDFELMLARIKAKNIFVTRIKSNTVYQTLRELELPADKDQHILQDELIIRTGTEAIKTGIKRHPLRRVAVFDEKNNRVIEIITNQLTWSAATIGALYKKRWDIELFFKALKQNLQVKTFIGTSQNAVKSQIYMALITYLLLELLRRNTCRIPQAFSNFSEKKLEFALLIICP
jgi:IS4 transposase